MSNTINWRRCDRCRGSGKAVIWGSTYESNTGIDVKCGSCAGTGKVALYLRPQHEIEEHAAARGSIAARPEPEKPWRPSDAG